MSLFVGFDTSNYTTSVAVFDDEFNKMISKKQLLPVEQGEKGLMQSKALFLHLRQLPSVTEAAFSSINKSEIAAVGVSDKPRNKSDSYMPVFLAGVAAASAVSSSSKASLYKTSHQIGHILSALYSCDRLDLIQDKFIAFHVSGGTTEALLVTPDKENIIDCEIVSQSLDLKAGQAIDRIGVMLGLGFPAGAELDKLSHGGVCKIKPKPVFKGVDCCISGIENKCKTLLNNGESKENIARYAIEFISETIYQMTLKLKKIYGEIPLIYAGGVMSNTLIRERISKLGGIFCNPEYSSDNASGIAIYSYLKHKGTVYGK